MKNLTADFLNGYVNGLESEAKKAVFEILDINEIEDVFNHGCASGCAGGFIYYHQTEEFFDTYANEIFEMMNELKNEYGAEMFANFEFDKNNLTWLFIEETVREMIYSLELE